MVNPKTHIILKAGLLFFFLWNGVCALPQKEKPADMHLKLKNAQHDSDRSDISNKLSRYYVERSQYDSAQYYGHKALQFAQATKNKRREIAALVSIGVSFIYSSNYPEGLNYQLKALDVAEEIKDTLMISKINNNIGVAYGLQQDYKTQLEYFKKSLTLKLHYKDYIAISNGYGNIGGVYNNLNQHDSALIWFMESLKFAKKANDILQEGVVYGNMAGTFAHKKDQWHAIEYYKKAIAIQEEGEDYRGLTYNYGGLGICYVDVDDYKNATVFLKKCYDIALKGGANDQIMRSAKYLSRLYEKEKDFKNAFSYKNEELIYRDSVLNENNTKQVSQLQAKYDFDKKSQALKAEQDKKDAITKEELAKQKVVRNSFIGGFLLMFILGIVILRGYNQKQKSNKLLETKNELIEKQNKIVEQRNKDITDSISYAKRIQEAILPPAEFIKKHLPESFVLYQPKDIVAGDFYWMHTVDSLESIVDSTKRNHKPSTINYKLTLIAAADCTGHGVPGALVSVVCNNALNRSVLEFGLTDPGKILDKTRELVSETFSKSNNDVKDGMDISLVSILRTPNSELSTVKWAGANNPLLVVRKSQQTEINSLLKATGKQSKNSKQYEAGFTETLVLETKTQEVNNLPEYLEISGDKQPIGIFSEAIKPFTTHEMILQQDDTVYLFTDGYADQFGGPKGKKLKYSALRKLLLSVSEQTIDVQKKFLYSAFEDWKRNLEQVDDVCIIGIRI